MKWLDLGMSDPLTLGMAHPLTDRLECLASDKVNKVWSRSLTGALMFTVAVVTAPLTIASESASDTNKRDENSYVDNAEASHPEYLEDTIVHSKDAKINHHTTSITRSKNSKSASKINVSRNIDGNKHCYEININGDDIQAFKVNADETKTFVPLKDIKGYSAAKARESKTWSFDIDEDNQLMFVTGIDMAKRRAPLAATRYPAPPVPPAVSIESLRQKHAERKEDVRTLIKRFDSERNQADQARKSAMAAEIKQLKTLEKLEGENKEILLKKLKKLDDVRPLLESKDSKELSIFIDKDGEDSRIKTHNGNVIKVKRLARRGLNSEYPVPPAAPNYNNDTNIQIENHVILELGADEAGESEPPIILRYKTGENSHDVSAFHTFEHDFEFEDEFDHEALERLNLDRIEREAHLSAAESMLESVEELLEELKDSDLAKRDLDQAKRELKKARKSLKEAEKKLADK